MIVIMKKIVPLTFMLVVFVGFGYLATLPVKGFVIGLGQALIRSLR